VTLTWRVVISCPALGPDGELCEGEAGHAPIREGEHWCSDWDRGEIVGLLAWSSPPAADQ
jgi:hypothetical protein